MEDIKTLDQLLSYIQTEEVSDTDMSDLPTFGGDTPSDTMGIWSWDQDRLLIGTCADDYEIVERLFWAELTAQSEVNNG